MITGTGTDKPSGAYVVSIPGYAKLTDSNVNFNIYADAAKTVSSWKVPGPDVWPGKPGQPILTSDLPPVSTTGGVVVTDPLPPVTTIAPPVTSIPVTTIAPPASETPGSALYGKPINQHFSFAEALS